MSSSLAHLARVSLAAIVAPLKMVIPCPNHDITNVDGTGGMAVSRKVSFVAVLCEVKSDNSDAQSFTTCRG